MNNNMPYTHDLTVIDRQRAAIAHRVVQIPYGTLKGWSEKPPLQIWSPLMNGKVAWDDKILRSLCAYTGLDFEALTAEPSQAELGDIRFRYNSRRVFNKNCKANLKWFRSFAKISMSQLGVALSCSATNIAHYENPKKSRYLPRADCQTLIALTQKDSAFPRDITPETFFLPPNEFQAHVKIPEVTTF